MYLTFRLLPHRPRMAQAASQREQRLASTSPFLRYSRFSLEDRHMMHGFIFTHVHRNTGTCEPGILAYSAVGISNSPFGMRSQRSGHTVGQAQVATLGARENSLRGDAGETDCMECSEVGIKTPPLSTGPAYVTAV